MSWKTFHSLGCNSPSFVSSNKERNRILRATIRNFALTACTKNCRVLFTANQIEDSGGNLAVSAINLKAYHYPVPYKKSKGFSVGHIHQAKGSLLDFPEEGIRTTTSLK
jgi:hypothetical protein